MSQDEPTLQNIYKLLKTLNKRFDGLEKEQKQMGKEQNQMKESIDKLDKKVGGLFEISARNELRRKFGDEFARNFRTVKLNIMLIPYKMNKIYKIYILFEENQTDLS